ncbi:MAG: M1 family aminopeptidase, partial [Myxococcota bacterium]
DDRADAMVLANGIVMAGHADAAAMNEVAHARAPLRSTVTDLAWISIDEDVEKAFRGPDDLDPYELVIFGASKEAQRAAERVERLVEARLDLLRRQRLVVANRVAWDRIDRERGTVGEQGNFALLDALTEQRFAIVAPNQPGPADRWLTAVRDETGAVDLRRRVRVSARGVSGRGVMVDRIVSGELFPGLQPDDPTSAPRPPVRAEPVLAKTEIRALPEGIHARVEITSDLQLEAVGGPISRIELRVPRAGAVRGAFEIVNATLLDGTPLLGQKARTLTLDAPPDTDPEPEPPEPGPDPRPRPDPDPEPEAPPQSGLSFGVVDLLLPEPLQPGERVVVRLQHRDIWPMTQIAQSYLGLTNLGTSSGMQTPLPQVVPEAPGGGWGWDMTVRVPHDKKWRAAVSGRTVQESAEKNGWVTVRAVHEGPGRFPAVVLGKFDVYRIPSLEGMPSARINLFPANTLRARQTFGPEIRRIASFYEGFLPPFPVPEIEIAESPRGHNGFVWIAPHGMAILQRTRVMGTLRVGSNLRNDLPKLESSVFSHELAHQYWGHLAPAASIEDAWINETMSESFSCMYVGHAYKPKDCIERMANHRRRWEGRNERLVRASLTRAYETPDQPRIVYSYGPVTLLDGLQRKIGPGPFYAALDMMLRQHPNQPLTTERLQYYFELASGQELDDWFAFFVHGGYVPRLDVSGEVSGRTLSGTVTADVPFGTFEVPLRVITKNGTTQHLVTVTDGEGRFALPCDHKKARVEIDPTGYLVHRGPRVARAR